MKVFSLILLQVLYSQSFVIEKPNDAQINLFDTESDQTYDPNGVKVKRCPGPVVGAPLRAEVLPITRRDLQTSVNKRLCQNCLNSSTCKVHGKCDLCKKWCENSEPKVTGPGVNGPIVGSRMSEVPQKKFFPLGRVHASRVIELVAQLLGIKNGKDIDQIVILGSTKSNKPPQFTSPMRTFTPEEEAVFRRVLEEELNKLKATDPKGHFTDDVINRALQDALQKYDQESNVVGEKAPNATEEVGCELDDKKEEIVPFYPLLPDNGKYYRNNAVENKPKTSSDLHKISNPSVIDETPDAGLDGRLGSRLGATENVEEPLQKEKPLDIVAEAKPLDISTETKPDKTLSSITPKEPSEIVAAKPVELNTKPQAAFDNTPTSRKIPLPTFQKTSLPNPDDQIVGDQVSDGIFTQIDDIQDFSNKMTSGDQVHNPENQQSVLPGKQKDIQSDIFKLVKDQYANSKQNLKGLILNPPKVFPPKSESEGTIVGEPTPEDLPDNKLIVAPAANLDDPIEEPEPSLQARMQDDLVSTPLEDQISNSFGKIVPSDGKLNLNTSPNNLFFIGSGIKLPLQMHKNQDGTMDLSVDLEKLCNCQNKTCPKNHQAIEEAVGTILEKEAELKNQLESIDLETSKDANEKASIMKRSPGHESADLSPIKGQERYDELSQINDNFKFAQLEQDLENKLEKLNNNVQRFREETMFDMEETDPLKKKPVRKIIKNLLGFMKNLAINEE